MPGWGTTLGLIVQRYGHPPVTGKTGVRLPVGPLISPVRVAQLDESA